MSKFITMAAEDRAIQIWEYLEGQCSPADAARIAQLIATDGEWQAEHEAVLAMHSALQHVEAEAPSLRFAQNVMDVIAAHHVAPATKQYVNPVLMKGIAVFFIIVIVCAVGYSLASVNWQVETGSFARFAKIQELFSGKTMGVLVGFNVILLLVLVDRLLNRHKVHS